MGMAKSPLDQDPYRDNAKDVFGGDWCPLQVDGITTSSFSYFQKHYLNFEKYLSNLWVARDTSLG